MERDAPQSTPPATLCKAGCGFYGSPNFDSMCSKCFKEALKKKNQNPSQNDGGPVVEATSIEAMITAPAHTEKKDQESKTRVTTSVLREFEDQTDEVNDDGIDDDGRNSDDDDTDDGSESDDGTDEGSEGDDGTDDGSESDDQDMVDVDVDDDFSDDASDGVYDVNLHDFFDGDEGWAWLGDQILNANNSLEEDEDGQGEDADDMDGGRKRSSTAKDAGSPKKTKLDASPSGSPSPSSTSAALLGAASTTAAPPQPAANQSPAPIQSTSAGAVEASAGVSLPAALETGSPTIPVVTSAAAGSSSVAEASGGAEEGVVVAEAPVEEGDKDGKKPKKNRCHECRKKVGLTGFECRCGGLFCSLHRYSDKHQCTFDYHALGAEQIRKANPVVVSEKVQKI